MTTEANLQPMIIAAAIAAAGPRPASDYTWEQRVNAAIPSIVAMMHESSRPWKIADEVLNATVFVGTYVSHSVEESSTRCLVQIDTGRPSRNYPDGVEPIRSHRTDNPQGQAMQKRLADLRAGDEILVYKTMESSGEGADANKVRTLVHFRLLRRAERAETAEPRREQPAPKAERVEEGGPLTERFNALPNPIKIEVVKRLRAAGISFPEPEPYDEAKYILIIQEVEAEHAR